MTGRGLSEQAVDAVSADEYVATIRLYADRVHDLMRRAGLEAGAAVEVSAGAALDLLETLASRPETVSDLLGWWVNRALRLAKRVTVSPTEASTTRVAGTAGQSGGTRGSTRAGGTGTGGGRGGGSAERRGAGRRGADEPASVLAGTRGEAEVRDALLRLPAAERVAVMLRDAYDLPPRSVAVALGVGTDTAMDMVTRGRLGLVAVVDDRPSPSLGAHPARPSVDYATLGMFADGSLFVAPGTETAALRRHVSGCDVCGDIVDAAAKGRRLASGLPVLALPDDDRDLLLAEASQRAAVVLPTVEEVQLAREVAEEQRPPVLAPGLVVASVVLAVLLGVFVAYLTRGGSSGGTPAGSAPSASASARGASASPHPHRSPKPSTKPSASVSPSTLPATTPPSPTPSSVSPSATAPPVLAVHPTRGPNGTVITVVGTGWPAGSAITVEFIDTSGSVTSTSSATASSAGAFSATVHAQSLLPGSCTVRANGGGHSADAAFTDTL